MVAVWLDDTILAVRHSYKPSLCLVGGRVRRRDDHRRAAARELQEEVGVTIDCDALRLVMVAPSIAARSSKPDLCILVCCVRCATETRSVSIYGDTLAQQSEMSIRQHKLARYSPPLERPVGDRSLTSR